MHSSWRSGSDSGPHRATSRLYQMCAFEAEKGGGTRPWWTLLVRASTGICAMLSSTTIELAAPLTADPRAGQEINRLGS